MSTEKPENIAVSSAEQFKQRRLKKEQGELLELTSGLTIKVKRPEIAKLISSGIVPANLVQVFLNQKGKSTDNISAEDLSKLMQFQKIVAQNSVIEPKIVDEPDYNNGEIALEDIEDTDLEDIWQYVNGGLEAVKSFREQRSKLLSGYDSNTIPEQTA